MTFSRELSPAWGRHVGDSLEEHSRHTYFL